jgi:membrane protease YdiL (CAAX protease family)
MYGRLAAVGKVLAFLVTTLALGWGLARAAHAMTTSEIGAEGGLAAAALAVSWIATKLEHRPFASVGFAERAPARAFGIGVLLGVAILAGSAALLAGLGWYTAQLMVPEPLSRWLVTAVVLSALIALFEETLFRGYALQTLARAFGGRNAIIFTGLVFGTLHLVNPTPGMPTWLKLLGCAFVAAYGMLVAILRGVSGGLWLPIGLHFVWNLLEEFVFGFADSGVASDGALFHATVTGPVILTGGTYGPEAGLVMLTLACATTALVLVRLPWRTATWSP